MMQTVSVTWSSLKGQTNLSFLVLTKVGVYMGIGAIASGAIPILFEKLEWGVMNGL